MNHSTSVLPPDQCFSSVPCDRFICYRFLDERAYNIFPYCTVQPPHSKYTIKPELGKWVPNEVNVFRRSLQYSTSENSPFCEFPHFLLIQICICSVKKMLNYLIFFNYIGCTNFLGTLIIIQKRSYIFK